MQIVSKIDVKRQILFSGKKIRKLFQYIFCRTFTQSAKR